MKVFIAILFCLLVFGVCFKWLSSNEKDFNYWSLLTKNDLKASFELIKLNHPAASDNVEDHPTFNAWLNSGYNKSLKKSREVTTYEGYKFTLAYFIAGFKDGHFRIHTPDIKTPLWPGFLLAYCNNKYYIKRIPDLKALIELPPENVEVIACNNKNPSCLMQSNIFPYVSDDPKLNSSWIRKAPFLLVDQHNPYLEKIETITYSLNGKEYTYHLQWHEINSETLNQYIQVASYGKPLDFQAREFGKNNIWISIPTFNDQSQETTKALSEIVNILPSFRNKDIIIFDVRGNRGGSSHWVVKILKSLYGSEFLGGISHFKNETAYAEDKVSQALIHFIEVHNNQHVNHKFFNKHLENLKSSFNRGDLFMRREIDVNEFFKMKNGKHDIRNPVQGKVYLLTDGNCFSSCLIFADSILSIPGVVHIGSTTNADTKFSQPIPFDLPGGKSRICIPSMIRRNWERGDNEPYHPQHKFFGFMGDQQKLEEWILNL